MTLFCYKIQLYGTGGMVYPWTSIQKTIYIIDETVYVDISDNGCGMDEATLREVMAKVQDYTKKRRKSSIGLYNINRRIKLNYGEQYGLDIQSTLGEGTMVRVTIPAIKTQNETEELR